VSSLLQSIKDIPERNEHKKDALMKRCQSLINESSVRPAVNDTRYEIARSLLCDITKQIPRLSYQQRQAMGVTEALINPIQARHDEEERMKKEAEKANPWGVCMAMYSV
jgi:hypothetical protein